MDNRSTITGSIYATEIYLCDLRHRFTWLNKMKFANLLKKKFWTSKFVKSVEQRNRWLLTSRLLDVLTIQITKSDSIECNIIL